MLEQALKFKKFKDTISIILELTLLNKNKIGWHLHAPFYTIYYLTR